MAKKALFILADGFEETEAILPIDILNRTGVEVTTATLGDDASAPVAAAHGTRHLASTTLDEALARPDGFDAIVLPGGMPGTVNLRNDSRVAAALRNACAAGKLVAAICAAPTVLAAAGILRGRRFTCYPGCEEGISGAAYCADEATVRDGCVLTSRGPGTAAAFGFALAAALAGDSAAIAVGKAMLFH